MWTVSCETAVTPCAVILVTFVYLRRGGVPDLSRQNYGCSDDKKGIPFSPFPKERKYCTHTKSKMKAKKT